MVPGVTIVSILETECRRSSVYKLMQLHIYMPLAARGHLATMDILHDDFGSFGDNVTSSTPAFRQGVKVEALLRAGATIFWARRAFGIDFDGCRSLGRYLIARTAARFSPRAFPAPDFPFHSSSTRSRRTSPQAVSGG